jgi:transketolase
MRASLFQNIITPIPASIPSITLFGKWKYYQLLNINANWIAPAIKTANKRVKEPNLIAVRTIAVKPTTGRNTNMGLTQIANNNTTNNTRNNTS